MIIYSKKKKLADRDKRENANKAKDMRSPTERRQFLNQIRCKEQSQLESSLTYLPDNKISDFFSVAGVYFLFNGTQLVYIGESNCLITRIVQHRMEGVKIFDAFKFIGQPDTDRRRDLEKRMIQRYAPLYNVSHNPNLNNASPINKIVRNEKIQP